MPLPKKPKKAVMPETFISLVAHFLDFLTVSIHTILYERGVYPHESFDSTRRYNYPVRHSRVEEVREWINEAIDAIEVELLKGIVDRISIVIYSRFNDPLERFVFDLSRFPIVAKRDWHVPFESASPEANAKRKKEKVKVIDMEQQFRAVMTRLQFCQRELDPLPEDISWTVAVEVKQEADPPGPINRKLTPWIAIEPSLQKEPAFGDRPARNGTDVGGVKTTPLRAVEAGEMIFELWVEEGSSKIDALDRERFSDEYEDETMAPENLPGFNMEPKIELNKGKKKDENTGNDKDEFDDMDDDLENMSQYSFLADK
jgi:mitotic spindle assembly checkpoint protein MAD2B